MVKMSDIHELVMNRAIKTANHFINNPEATVRSTAIALRSNRSTVHIDLVHNLKEANMSLYLLAKAKLEKNKNERSERGGVATRKRWVTKNLQRNRSEMGKLCDFMSNRGLYNNG